MAVFIDARQVYNKPPAHIYDRAVKQFGVDFNDGVLFTYNGNVHSKGFIPEHLWEHEMTHVRQQKEMGADAWWDKYFVDAQFRMEQEVEAYHNQYKFFRDTTNDRNKVFSFLHEISTHLCQIYDLDITLNQAMKMIKSGDVNS